jgi:hypothetical protein
MHRVGDRRYVGGPGETVTVTTQVAGGGQESRDVDGQPLVGNQFPLPGVGGTRRLRITLVGPVGASSVVGIGVVDGGQDGDLLLCQPHDPAPVQFYDFAVAPKAAMESLARIRRVVAEKVKEPPAAKTRKTRKPRKKARTAKTRRTGRGTRGGRP